MNREMRRLQAKEEERAKKRRAAVPQRQKKERTPISQFLREVRQELKKVAWPSREETTRTAIAVFVFTLIMSLFFWALDSGLLWLTRTLVGAAD